MEVDGAEIGVEYTEKHCKVAVFGQDDNIVYVLEILDEVAGESGIHVTRGGRRTRLLPRKPVSKVAQFFVDLSLSLFGEFAVDFTVSVDEGDGDDEEFMNLLRNAASHEATAVAVVSAPQQQTPIRHDVNRLVREAKQGPSHILGTKEARRVFLGDKAKAKAHLEAVREQTQKDVDGIREATSGGQHNEVKHNGRKYKVHTGSRGGRYILVGKDKNKVYV